MKGAAGLGLSIASKHTAPAGLGERLAATPRLACEALARALNHADLNAALACFSPGACLIGPEGTAVHGEAAIGTLLAELIEARARVVIEPVGVIVASDLALSHERWTIGVEGKRASRFSEPSSQPTLVLRQIGGEWRIAIAAPWGQPAHPPLEAVGMSG